MRASPRTPISLLARHPGQSLIAAGLGLALAVVPVVFDPGLYDDFTLPKQATLLVASALIVAGLAIQGEFLPRGRILRLAILAWIGWLTLAFALGIDRRGSLLGYYQYRQGYLTQVAYVVLFLGGLSLARSQRDRWLAWAGLIGLGGTAAYVVIQSTGNDPVDWWVDTSARAIGTIGNANELAAYALIALAFAGCGAGLARVPRSAITVAVTMVAVFVVIESQSRSGLAALGIALAAFPPAALLAGRKPAAVAREGAILAGGAVLGVLISFAAGGAAGTAGRLQEGVTQAETGNSTRFELWKGTLATIEQSPVWGFGPDGLHLAFPRFRPANLHGAFDDYDLVAQSSHNWLLDTAANTGIGGLVALVAVLITAALGSLRYERTARSHGAPYVWSAMAGYVALTLVNPISLAAHAVFFVLLGVGAGRADGGLPSPAAARPAVRPVARAVLVAPTALALIGVSFVLPIADRRANSAWGAYVRGEFASAASGYGDAAGLLPIERHYARREAESWLAAGTAADLEALAQAEAAYEEFDKRFGFSSGEAIGLATARIGLSEPPRVILPVIEQALDLNPHGVYMEEYTAILRQAVASGGVLSYSERDRWVFVEPTALTSR